MEEISNPCSETVQKMIPNKIYGGAEGPDDRVLIGLRVAYPGTHDSTMLQFCTETDVKRHVLKVLVDVRIE
ncbi:hypothetical protein E3N88_39621 [Mikania micrantha]|uniref:Uncharacterized protein n=1 Tax=Mikania micrantha TaxID=192012 RepID=A0A5N6LX98_9ASTR|nr:hypothetical protein E3N88_39621 [Mikania micrantha]